MKASSSVSGGWHGSRRPPLQARDVESLSKRETQSAVSEESAGFVAVVVMVVVVVVAAVASQSRMCGCRRSATIPGGV